MRKILACCVICVIAACFPSALTATPVPAAAHIAQWHGPAVAEKAPLATPSPTPAHDGPAVAERAVREVSVPVTASSPEPSGPAVAEKRAPRFDGFEGPAVAEQAPRDLVPEPTEVVEISTETIAPIEPTPIVGPAVAEKPVRYLPPAIAEKPARELPPAVAEKAPHAAPVPAEPVIEVQVADGTESENRPEDQRTGRIVRIATVVAPHFVPKVWFATQWLITR